MWGCVAIRGIARSPNLSDSQQTTYIREVFDEGRACPTAGNLLQPTYDIRRGGHRAIDGHLLLDPVACPIVEEAIGGGGTRRRVLPGGQPPLVVVAQLCAGWHACARRGVIGGTAGHVTDRIIFRRVGWPAADAGNSVQVGAIATGITAQRPTGQTVERVIAERLRVVGA